MENENSVRPKKLLYLTICGLSISLVQTPSTAQQKPSQSSATDPYSVDFVRAALKHFQEFSQNGGFSFEIKKYTNLSPSLLELGDGVTIATLKIYDRNELMRPENANAYLTAVRVAFSNRSTVRVDSDREAKVTLFVLDYLSENEGAQPFIKNRITYLRRCVREFSCSPKAEHDFLRNQQGSAGQMTLPH